jgi:1-phosphofructokinase/tagatose 6-phosphate kinase
VIVTVTLNAAMARTITVPNFQRGRRHRASAAFPLAGGKGINVARALKTLGAPVVATGLAGGQTGLRIVERLTGDAILNDFVRIEGESRTTTAVVDPTSNTHTEINEWGPEVRPEELEMLLDKLAYLAQGAELVVFAGCCRAARPTTSTRTRSTSWPAVRSRGARLRRRAPRYGADAEPLPRVAEPA